MSPAEHPYRQRSEVEIGRVEFFPPTAAREWPDRIEATVMATSDLVDRLDRLEAKLDALILALKSAGVGFWRTPVVKG